MLPASKKPRGSTSHRSERVGERIRQVVSLVLDREISDPRLAGLNVTQVEVTGDLRLAKVYVAPPDADDETDKREVMDALAHAVGYFRRQLATGLDLRYTPEIRFYFDRSIELGEHFLQVLEQVQAEEKEHQKPTRGE